MKENEERKDRQSDQSSSAEENQSGDPGRTPGAAEGDRQTVEQDLRDKESEK
ncbi:MAG TPA: hypothetical protein VK619_09140 [Pyrinomonadaceae bacterium]|nr:hypothetical protein [Pyrinomonadaceae bacterium]